ncbi:hypothetical protein RIF29_15421 [Crotalaria pallida]|uniref:Uncharacterized protein n=1 Tax=Crotalaria pallida TaxID=3830 RepID=A0AAN9FH69_CROPI
MPTVDCQACDHRTHQHRGTAELISLACDRRTPAPPLSTLTTPLATPAPPLTTHNLDAHHAARDPLTQPPRVHGQPPPGNCSISHLLIC